MCPWILSEHLGWVLPLGAGADAEGTAGCALATGAWPGMWPSRIWACSTQISEGTTAALAQEKGENMTQLLGRLPMQRELKQALQGVGPVLCLSCQMEEDWQTGRRWVVLSEEQ